MARGRIQVVLLVALAAVLVFASQVVAVRSGLIREPIDRDHEFPAFFTRRGWSGLLCIPDVTQLLEEHEGREKCAYDHPNGYRAVGVGYDLDDDVKQRKSELATALADYDEVYSGKSCLNDLQISGLLLIDAKRALDRASKHVKPLNDFCCPVQAVIADIQHSAGSENSFPAEDLSKFIQKAAVEDYKSAAHALAKTDWCWRKENKKRCRQNLEVIKKGC